MDIGTIAVSVLSSGAVSGLLTLFLKRRAERKDAHEDRRVAAFDSVLEALGLLRAAGNYLSKNHDFNQQPGAEFEPANEAMKKARDLIEVKRLATGPVFADAAMSIVEYWDEETDILWRNDYNAKPIEPPLATRERGVYEAIPLELKERVAAGMRADLEKAARAESVDRRQMALAARPATVSAQALEDEIEGVSPPTKVPERQR